MIYPIGGCSTHPIIHVAVADVDAAYGAYAAAENNTFNNTNNRNNTANNNANNNVAKKRSAKNLRAAAAALELVPYTLHLIPLRNTSPWAPGAPG